MVTINGIDFNVDFTNITRSLRKSYKYQVTTEDGVEHSELRAVYMDFSLGIGNLDAEDYDTLMALLRTTPGEVTITLPAGRQGETTYTGAFNGIQDELITQDGDTYYWDSLTLAFRGTVPISTGAGG